LLSNYGKIDYIWFDGCGSEGHTYDTERIINEIFRLQPHILTHCSFIPEHCDIRWVGNEDGFASLNNPLIVSRFDFSERTPEMELSDSYFWTAECDCKMRSTWFYDNNEETLKTVDELFGMYEFSVSFSDISAVTVMCAVIYGICLIAAQYGYTFALKSGKVGLCSTIYSLGFVFPTLSGSIFWNETLNIYNIFGVILIIPILIISGMKKQRKL